MIIDDVAIAARRGAEPGVKSAGTCLTQRTAMSPGKFAFTPSVQAASFRCARVSKCTHLAGAMDAGVGAAGAKDGNRFVRHLRERLFQLLLHAAHFVLPLPAVIFAAVVLDAQRDFTESAVAPSQTSVQVLLNQLLGDLHRHQRAAEAHVIRYRPELDLLRHTVIVMHAADGEAGIA